jgi:hypothetical protein
MFMGTPHHGIDKIQWRLMAKDMDGAVRAPSQLLTAIDTKSETLQNISDQFAALAKRFRIYFFWEGLETDKGAIKGYVVSQDSAAPMEDDGAERSGIHATHSQMCKFRNVDSPGFQSVLTSLRRFATDAPPIIDRRWTEERNHQAMRRSSEAAELLGFDAHKNNEAVPRLHNDSSEIRNKYFRIPNRLSTIFTSREHIAQGLQKKILGPSNQKSPLRQKRFVLYGLGGSGKSQFCLKFAQDNRDRYEFSPRSLPS